MANCNIDLGWRRFCVRTGMDSSMANCNIDFSVFQMYVTNLLDPSDPQFQTLAKISEGERLDYEPRRARHAGIWKGSPFEWLCPKPSSSEVGKIVEEIFKKWCEQNNIGVQKSGKREFDLLIGKSQKPVEFKFSTLWEKGFYKFQQIRKKQKYEYLVCLGVSPNDAHCWVFPKDWLSSEAIAFKPFKLLRRQHAGKKGKDTYWLTIDLSNQEVLDYLRQRGCGGKLSEAIQIMQNW